MAALRGVVGATDPVLVAAIQNKVYMILVDRLSSYIATIIRNTM